MRKSTESKFDGLKRIIGEMGNVLIAYSGGVDSTFLLKISIDCLGREKVLAVTAKSPFFPERELLEAKRIGELLGANHLIFEHNELEVEEIVSNPKDRCYYCKRELFRKLTRIAEECGIRYVIDGTTLSDVGDFRPGLRAKEELNVRSPLLEAGLKKEEIREISKSLNLPTYDKPSFACLASRFPYGRRITENGLKMVEKAEDFFLDQGLRAVRVRHYGNLARIEVEKEEMDRFLDPKFRKKVIDAMKKLGYVYITLDLEGLRSGSMNEEILRGEKDG